MTPTSPRIGQAIFYALFFVGAALCVCFLETMAGVPAVLIVAAIATALRAACALTRSPRRALRIFGWFAALATAAFHALWLYLAIAWGSLLAWSTAWWVRALVALLAALAIATLRRRPPALRVPIALPTGIWIAFVLLGWQRGEAELRCDDFLRVRAQPSIEIITATSGAAPECRPGEVIPIGRYARKTWESRDGKRFIVTTQAGTGADLDAALKPHFTGNACEIVEGGATRCVGDLLGKTHGFAEAEPLGKLFIAGWGIEHEGRHDGSVVYAVPLDGPFTIQESHHFDGIVGDLFYVHGNGEIRLFRDSCDAVLGVRAADFSPLPDSPMSACPGELRYDPARDEGVWCGSYGIGAAFRGNPFTVRFLGEVAQNPTAVGSISWGCDWDPEARKVYSAIPNLGLMAVIDYDTGRIERRFFTGFGLRSVAFDRARRRVYASDFLGGDVIAFDSESGREVQRWFVGRYVRDVRLTRDRSALMVTSNVGLLRIHLDAP